MSKKKFSFFRVLLLSFALTVSFVTTPDSLVAANEVQSNVILLETNLKDGLVTKADKLTFDLWAKDDNGNKIHTSNITVTNNGENVPINWDDSEKTSYTLDLVVGINEVIIKVNHHGEMITQTYTLTREAAEDGDVIGTYVFAIEAFSIGLDYIVEPVVVDIKKGQNAAMALHDELTANGFLTMYIQEL